MFFTLKTLSVSLILINVLFIFSSLWITVLFSKIEYSFTGLEQTILNFKSVVNIAEEILSKVTNEESKYILLSPVTRYIL